MTSSLGIKRSPLGTFGGVQYVQYDGLFVGRTSTGNFRVPYRISAPANPRRANHSTVLVEPPHAATGTYLREGYLGMPFLFGRGFLHASVGYSTYSTAPPLTAVCLTAVSRGLPTGSWIPRRRASSSMGESSSLERMAGPTTRSSSPSLAR